MQNWYLVRTKSGGERTAQGQLQHVVERTLLPLGKIQVRQRGRAFQRIQPPSSHAIYLHSFVWDAPLGKFDIRRAFGT